MSRLGWIIVLLAAFEAGWMLFDGSRALIVGDYVTPKSGPYAGQLGPWHRAVSAVGIEPRSTLMKSVFVTYGAAWLCIVACFVLRFEWSWWAMLLAACGALWFAPVGTLFSLVQIVLLIVARGRT